MTDRFSPLDIIRAHGKGLRNRVYNQRRPVGVADRLAAGILYGVPVAMGLAAWRFDFKLGGAEELLGAFGILTGAFFMAFTQLATWRERFTARIETRGTSEVHQRDSLDEAVAHVLMALYASFISVAVLIAGMNFEDKHGNQVGGWAAVEVALAAYVFLLVMLIIPKLYIAYAKVNQLDDEMSGLSR